MTHAIKEKHRDAIIKVIAANDRVDRAVIFGSRAMGTNSITSDLDIALFGDSLTLRDRGRIAAEIDEIPMAQLVDIVLYRSVDNPRLQQHVKEYGIEWFNRSLMKSGI